MLRTIQLQETGTEPTGCINLNCTNVLLFVLFVLCFCALDSLLIDTFHDQIIYCNVEFRLVPML